MNTLHYSITIHAPRPVVWDTMLAAETYRQWTSAFCEGSDYQGSWDEGSTILFLGPTGEGMRAVIAENRLHERISIRHLACIGKEKEEPVSGPMFENYSFRDVDGGTGLLVEMDCEEKYEAMFEEMWPRALQRLKDLCESKNPNETQP